MEGKEGERRVGERKNDLTHPLSQIPSYATGIFIQIFVLGSERRTCFETQCVMALQGHLSSLILTPIESADATSYRSSIVTLVLSCPVSEILKVSREERPHPYSTRILGVFRLD